MRSVLVFAVAMSALTGCQSARYVVRESDHGVVAIPLDSSKYRREAEELMQEHFPDGYTIVREEQAPVEQTASYHQQVSSQFVGTSTGRPTAAPSNSLSKAGPQTELRITYFRDQPASPQAAAAAAESPNDVEAGESLFSTAGMIEPARTSN